MTFGRIGIYRHSKTLVHPELGAIEVDCQVLFTEDQTQALLVLTAPPRSEGYQKLRLLAVLGHERFTETAASPVSTTDRAGASD